MEAMDSPKGRIELFHLLFLEQLGQKLDKSLYALKGGCNLRFFLGSIRYSEDVDIDIQRTAPHTLKNLVNKILSGVPFQQILQARNMCIVDCSTPKQTATTQRWKIKLEISNQSLLINTKIEFSRRDSILNAVTELISRDIILSYKIRPYFSTHYGGEMALQQKIRALISRSETQSRDIFDIHHLMQTYTIKLNNLFNKDELTQAIERISEIKFPAFKSQVLSYLERDHQMQYDDPYIWDSMIGNVLDYLKKGLI